MTLLKFEIWTDLEGHIQIPKDQKSKTEKERVFLSTVDEKKQDGFTRLLSWNAKRIFVSTNVTGKIQHENL